MYVGQSGLAFHKIIREYKVVFCNNKLQDSIMAVHCIETGNDYEQVDVSMEHECAKGKIINELEEVETVRLASD